MIVCGVRYFDIFCIYEVMIILLLPEYKETLYRCSVICTLIFSLVIIPHILVILELFICSLGAGYNSGV